MVLEPGRTLAHYRLIEQIGEGGMGVVWKAVDTSLDREVAIKILPELFSRDHSRRVRFEREAKLLASLNHPNLAAVYGLHEEDGVFFLAMELIPGEDLARRLAARGALPLDELLGIGLQLCDALQTAHDNGVIHRDLKPANILLTPDDKVKVLDFGLARGPESGGTASGSFDPSQSPTATSAGTLAGAILGTASYMSPEQARGRSVDRRTDLWALGCVLYEMLTGESTFPGETVTDVLSAVVSREPNWNRLPAETPAGLRRLLQRCLQKDAGQRLRDAGDARLDLLPAVDDGPLTSTASAVPRGREVLAWTLVAALVVTAGWLAWRSGDSGEERGSSAYVFSLTDLPGTDRALISPNGRYIVFQPSFFGPAGGSEPSARKQGDLWIRDLAQRSAKPLPGTRRAKNPFWSPDSRYVAFFADGELKRVALGGTPPETLTRVPGGWCVGDWGPHGTIIVEITENPEAEGWYLWRPGSPELERIRSYEGQRLAPDKGWPSFLPDGKHVLFTESVNGMGHVQVGSIDSDESWVLAPADSLARYASPGYLLYVRDGALLAHPFDAERRELTGDPVRLVDSVYQFTPTGEARFSVSMEGTLAFRPPPRGFVARWVDRAGRTLADVMEAGWYRHPKLSPDGRRLAIDVYDPRTGTPDIWLRDLERDVSNRLTSSPRTEYFPVWSPDGNRLLYSADWEGPPNLYLCGVDDCEPEVLVPANRLVQNSESWSRDGRYIVFTWTDRSYVEDLWLIDLDDASRTPKPLLDTPYNTYQARISPDGRWLAYCSDETGSAEIYVRAFPEGSRAVRISTGGGTSPVWSRDGTELYFLSPDGALMAAPVIDRADFRVGTPERLFLPEGRRLAGYDVTSEHDRFLALVADPALTHPPIEVIVDWPSRVE